MCGLCISPQLEQATSCGALNASCARRRLRRPLENFRFGCGGITNSFFGSDVSFNVSTMIWHIKCPLFAGTRGIISCTRFTVKVGKEGLEPSHLAAHGPKPCVSAIPPLPQIKSLDDCSSMFANDNWGRGNEDFQHGYRISVRLCDRSLK